MVPLSTVQIRTVCFGSQLVGGLLSKSADTDLSHRQLGKSLLLFSAQLSHCRTTLRLFDDLAMLAYSHSYGVGVRVRGDSTLKRFWSSYLTFIIIVLNGIAVCVNIRSSVFYITPFIDSSMRAACLLQEDDPAVRWISVLSNVADQLYYPCEHIAWAADAELIKIKSDKWWLFSTVLWGASLLLGIFRSVTICLKNTFMVLALALIKLTVPDPLCVLSGNTKIAKVLQPSQSTRKIFVVNLQHMNF